MPDVKLERFIKTYNLPAYDAEILTRDKKMSDFFEEAVKIGKKYKLSTKQIANHVINKKINPNTILAADVISWILEGIDFKIIEHDVLKETVNKVIEENQKAVEDYKKGKIQVIGFLIGKVKQKFPKGDINQIKDALEKYLMT